MDIVPKVVHSFQHPVGQPGMSGSIVEIKVPGGRLYKSTDVYYASPATGAGGLQVQSIGVAMTFVPDSAS